MPANVQNGREKFVQSLRNSTLTKDEVVVVIEYLLLNLSLHLMAEDTWKVKMLFYSYSKMIDGGLNTSEDVQTHS